MTDSRNYRSCGSVAETMWQEGASLQQIADRFGVTTIRVSHWLGKAKREAKKNQENKTSTGPTALEKNVIHAAVLVFGILSTFKI